MISKFKTVGIALALAMSLNGCAADGSLSPQAGAVALGVGLATLGAAAAVLNARRPVYVEPVVVAPVCYNTYYGVRCY